MQFRLAVCITLLAACGNGGPEGPPDANPFCTDAVNHSDLPWIQENILTPSCSRFSSCHQRDSHGRLPSDAAHLTLEDGETESQLVNVDSDLYGPDGSEQPGTWKRVVPGDPAHSYLMVVLGDAEGPLFDCNDDYATCVEHNVGTMPYQNPLLCQEQRDAIARWITDLAPAPDAGVADAGPVDAAP